MITFIILGRKDNDNGNKCWWFLKMLLNVELDSLMIITILLIFKNCMFILLNLILIKKHIWKVNNHEIKNTLRKYLEKCNLNWNIFGH